jgi:hypothetical protein
VFREIHLLDVSGGEIISDGANCATHTLIVESHKETLGLVAEPKTVQLVEDE